MKPCKPLIRFALLMTLSVLGCSTLPTPKHDRFKFPETKAFLGKPERSYTIVGQVKSKVNFQTLDMTREEGELCRNYYNKSVKQLVKDAISHGGDAVIQVRSIVFLEDGRREEYPTPECADDGMEGQVLTQGVAIKWTS